MHMFLTVELLLRGVDLSPCRCICVQWFLSSNKSPSSLLLLCLDLCLEGGLSYVWQVVT